MRFFDFHCHPILKQLFNDSPNIDSLIYKNDVAFIPKFLSDLPNIIESQLHQSQLAQFNEEVVVGAVLYSPERYVAKAVIPLIPYLKASSRYKLSKNLLEKIEQNQNKAFSDFLMNRTLQPYIEASRSFNILTKDSFKIGLPKNKVNVFFIIEGCHSLVDENNYCDANHRYNPDSILKNIDKVLAKVKVLAVNITHLQQSSLCNHAFGMQLSNSTDFLPTGNGFENEGRKVVQGLFDRKICVDVKHMSYQSRKDIMAEMEAGKFKNKQPLVCTHAGFIGTNFKNWPGYMQVKKTVSGAIYVEHTKPFFPENNPRKPGFPTFNLSTINLFDEEIAWIVKNNGVIGISLDRRILGYVDRYDENPTGQNAMGDRIVDKEYFSKTEWLALGIKNQDIGKKINDDNCLTLAELEELTEHSIPQRDEYFYDHFLNHLFHYFKVCKAYGIDLKKAQKQITVGSDFDGLINPFLNIYTVDKMVNLKSYVRMNFSYFLDSIDEAQSWSKDLNIDTFVEDLFYNNGIAFVKSRFQ